MKVQGAEVFIFKVQPRGSIRRDSNTTVVRPYGGLCPLPVCVKRAWNFEILFDFFFLSLLVSLVRAEKVKVWLYPKELFTEVSKIQREW